MVQIDPTQPPFIPDPQLGTVRNPLAMFVTPMLPGVPPNFLARPPPPPGTAAVGAPPLPIAIGPTPGTPLLPQQPLPSYGAPLTPVQPMAGEAPADAA